MAEKKCCCSPGKDLQLNKFRFKALRPELDGTLTINNRHVFVSGIDKYGNRVLPKDFVPGEVLPVERFLEGGDFPSIGVIVNILSHADMRNGGARYKMNELLPQAPITANIISTYTPQAI